MKDSSKLLKHLDAPMRFLSFSAGDFIAYCVPFFLGAFFDSLFIIPVSGIFCVMVIKKVLKKFPKFYAIRYLYWSLPTRRFNKMLRVNLPFSSKRSWMN